jgi:hypothetical protein
MAHLKHVGRIKNTGRRCIVIFREIYDENGHVIDGDNCLILETESLPDAEHQDIMRIVESEPAQATGNVYDIFARQRLGNGTPALNWMVSTKRLRKFPTSTIELTPDSQTVLGLDTLNKIVKMQKTGATEADIKRVLQDDTDMPPRQASMMAETTETAPATDATSQSGDEGVMDDAAIAQSYMSQAEMFEAQAKELREQAIQLDPSLKPKRTRKTPPKKEPANKKA